MAVHLKRKHSIDVQDLDSKDAVGESAKSHAVITKGRLSSGIQDENVARKFTVQADNTQHRSSSAQISDRFRSLKARPSAR